MKLVNDDKTNFVQSLMHMVKGNLGTGILAMAKTFSHAGLVNSIIGLPLICLINTYCVHLLVSSANHVERKLALSVARKARANNKSNNIVNKTETPTTTASDDRLEYAQLARLSFKTGPKQMRCLSNFMKCAVDVSLIVSQIGVCCVYLVFVVDNLTEILKSRNVHVNKNTIFATIYPIALLLSYIRTLRRLAIASACANAIQALGIGIIVEYLVRDLKAVDLSTRDMFRPTNEVAMAFASAMFAFEGIAVVLPVYTRMREPSQMSKWLGVVNVSYVSLMFLYFLIGFLGYLRFGSKTRDSITLDLPPEPLYDCVRAMFTTSIFLSYPLQFYVLNDILWTFAKSKLKPKTKAIVVDVKPVLTSPKTDEVLAAASATKESPLASKMQFQKDNMQEEEEEEEEMSLKWEYLFRTLLVSATFVAAASVPKLNFLMDLVGSVSATLLCLILPALIHIAAFYNDLTGFKKFVMVFADLLAIIIGFAGGSLGATFSVMSLLNSFHHIDQHQQPPTSSDIHLVVTAVNSSLIVTY